MAVLELEAAAARTRIVASDMLLDLDRRVGLLLTVGGEIVVLGAHLAHIIAAWSLRGPGRLILAERNESAEKE